MGLEEGELALHIAENGDKINFFVGTRSHIRVMRTNTQGEADVRTEYMILARRCSSSSLTARTR